MLPAIIAAMIDNDGTVTAVQRIYLTADGRNKADMPEPKRSRGDVLGHAIRIGDVTDVMAAGEGLETMLALRSLLPTMPVAAATSANHLGLFVPPPSLKRLYIAHDHGTAGLSAAAQLEAVARTSGIDVHMLTPPGDDDWNNDLIHKDPTTLYDSLTAQLVVGDKRFLLVEGKGAEAPTSPASIRW